MKQRHKPSLDGSGQKHALLVSRWNHFITERLEQAAALCLESLGVSETAMDSIPVSGAFELGPTALLASKSGQYDAVICIGCVIRGATHHFDYVASQAARLIAQASYDSGIPVVFGVLTTDTVEQAIERAGTKSGNKGHEAAMTAVEMVNVYRRWQVSQS